MEKLVIKPGANGHNSYAILGASYVDVYYGDAAAATFTVPAGANYVLFSATGDFYVRWDGSAAAIPSADVTNGAGSELNPVVRDVAPSQQFSIIAAAAVVVTMSFYK